MNICARLIHHSLLALSTIGMVATPRLGQAHIQMNYPPTRTDMVQNQTVLPCGGLPPMTNPTAVETGSTLQVQWVELIVHPGWYRISLVTNPNDAFTSNVLYDHIASVSGTTSYEQNVTLPSTACPQCTLQLIQVNTSGTDSTTPSGYVEYAACADLNVNPNAQAPTNTPVSGGSTTPTTGGTTPGGTTTGAPAAANNDGLGGCCAGEASWGALAVGLVFAWSARRRTRSH